MKEEKAKKIQRYYDWFRFAIVVVFLLAVYAVGANAQEAAKEDTPATLDSNTQKVLKALSKGKVIVTLFGDFGIQFQDGEKVKPGYNLDRAYLGYQYDFNEHWRVKAVYDMGKGDDESLHRVGYVKNAEIDYKTGRFGLNMGLTGTAVFDVQEKFWGYRYVYKSFMDDRGWGSSADLGVKASYQFKKWFGADVSIFNGEGYKKLQMDNQLLYGLGLTFTPAKGVTLRAYADFKTAQDTTCQEKVALFAGYQCKSFRIGAEGNMQFNHSNSNGHNLYGLSVYGAARLSNKWEAYGRYDWGTSEGSDGWVYSKDGHTGIIGANYQINKIFAISPNVRLIKTEGKNLKTYVCVSGKVSL